MNIHFTASAWSEYLFWQDTDKKVVRKIHELIKDISRDPFVGIGKPEPLKHTYTGYWSRRITDEHRLVYKIERETLVIFQVRYHYR
jgi:toxin YoeB